MLLLCLLLAAPASVRAVAIDGRAFTIPASLAAEGAAGTGTHALNLLVSADERPLLATLIHRGWTPRDARYLHPKLPGETRFQLGGRAPDLELEHAGARIDERLRLLLWRRQERLRDLPLWQGAALEQGGVQPLKHASQHARASHAARDRVLADLSFGLAQAREVGSATPGQQRLSWVELADPPPGAEERLGDVPAAEPAATALEEPDAPQLLPLPPVVKVSPEVINRPEKAGPRIALTFDACSTLDKSYYDSRVTAALRAAKAPATLFLGGRWAETHLAEVRELARDPLFELGNHSYTHPHMTEVPPERQREELLWTQQILFSLTGKVPRYFRPPYGIHDAEVAEVAAESGLRTVEFDYPSGDPDKTISQERLTAWVVAKARPGSIVVMHMNRHGWHTAEALPAIIAGLRKKGLTLSTVGELVAADQAARAK